MTKSELNKDLNFEDLSEFGDVSNMSPEDFFKTLEQSMRSKGDTEAHEKLEKIEEMVEAAISETQADEQLSEEEEINPTEYVHYVLDFANLEDVISFSKAIDFEVEASELYKQADRYHMTILLSLIDKPSYYANVMYARLLEHAAPGTKTRAYLQEHGIQLLLENAVENLRLIDLV